MAEVKLYINGQMILPEIAADMLAMTGWEDSESTRYCTTTKDNKVESYDLLLNSDRFIAYAGSEFVTLAISRNRNITIVVNLALLRKGLSEKFKDYDYLARTFYISNKLTELNVDSIQITTTKYNEDYLYLKWYIEDNLVEAYISFEV